MGDRVQRLPGRVCLDASAAVDLVADWRSIMSRSLVRLDAAPHRVSGAWDVAPTCRSALAGVRQDAVVDDKDPELSRVIHRLAEDLGVDAFVIEDHWRGDHCAVGVVKPDDRRFLVYISTFPPSGGERIIYQRERPSAEGDALYAADDMVEGASYAELLAAVRDHLLS